MSKQEFLDALTASLSWLPRREAEERVAFYAEMIDDRVEEGLTEAEAVLAIGSVKEISEQILADVPLIKIAKERMVPARRLGAWEIVLLLLGSPIWLSLAVAALATLLALYGAVWSALIAVWAVGVSVAASFLGGTVGGAVFIAQGHIPSGIATLGAALACAGLAIFLFFGSVAATKGVLHLTKKIALLPKKCFMKRGTAR